MYRGTSKTFARHWQQRSGWVKLANSEWVVTRRVSTPYVAGPLVRRLGDRSCTRMQQLETVLVYDLKKASLRTRKRSSMCCTQLRMELLGRQPRADIDA
jgi:hypothetical protein